MDKDELKEHRKNSFSQWVYSDQRIDLLIISISAGGIYVCLETLKYSLDSKLNNLFFLKCIGIAFIISMVLSFASQFCAKKSCKHDLYKWDDKLADRDSDDEERSAHNWDTVNTWLTNVSCFSTVIALISLTIYFAITF